MLVKAPILEFSGGVNNWTTPSLIPGNVAVELHNADVSSAVIRPRNAAAAFSGVPPEALSYLTATRSLVELGGAWYWSDNDTGTLDSSLGYMGVELPAATPTLTPGDRGTRFTGRYLYACTFVTKDGYESAPYFPAASGEPRWATIDCTAVATSASVDYPMFSTMRDAPGTTGRYGYTCGERVQYLGSVWECVQTCTRRKVNGALVANQYPGTAGQPYWKDVTSDTTALAGYATMKVTLPVPTGGNVTTVRIYRTADDSADFYQLADVSYGTTTYTDATDDVELLMGKAMDTMDGLPPVYRFTSGRWELTGGRYLTEVNSVGWLAVGDCVYFSEPGNLHAWKLLNFIKVSGTVTALARAGNGLIVLTAARAYLVTGTSLTDMVVRDLHTSGGCTNWRTVAYMRGSPMWVSDDGLAVYVGSSDLQSAAVRIVTDGQYRFTTDPLFAVAHRSCYIASMGDGTAVHIDFRTGRPVVTTFDTDADLGYYDGDSGKLLLAVDGTWFEHEAGTAPEWLYESPVMAGSEQVATKQKRWRRVRVDSDSAVSVTPIGLDGTEYATVTVGGAQRWSYLPPGIVGRALQLRIVGTGELRAVELEMNV